MRASEHGFGAHVGFLALDAPVFELLERDRSSGHGAAHEGARAHHAKIPVKKPHLRFARRRRMVVEAIEHRKPPDWRGTRGDGHPEDRVSRGPVKAISWRSWGRRRGGPD